MNVTGGIVGLQLEPVTFKRAYKKKRQHRHHH